MAEHKSRSRPESSSDAPDTTTPSRVSRHIQPLGARVLVRIIKSPDRTDAGLYLPQGTKDANTEALLAEVIEVARAMPNESVMTDASLDDDEDRATPDLGVNVSGIPVGAKVLLPKDRGITVPWDDTLRVVEVRSILAIVEVISQEDLQ